MGTKYQGAGRRTRTTSARAAHAPGADQTRYKGKLKWEGGLDEMRAPMSPLDNGIWIDYFNGQESPTAAKLEGLLSSAIGRG
ncbi:hypothetical protein NB231_04260 [Nitrococcus mobilis Nb-231]|uniref:Uncharacterized protein n=1 Tax=Nitrococcus mobilis Nb-231 TaxID=314278 RepID=A4BPT6_9GAMM|nr:hypothetical protein NB231_04260 [Nitrococcus mobilis Nb-231]